MIVIVSPTKSMKRKSYLNNFTEPLFLKESNVLRKILKAYDRNKLKDTFKISDKLTDQVYNYFQDPKEKIAAINLYEGLAFKNMELETFKKADFDFLNKHLYILSAMYGILRPSDAILEYRLDYVVKFEKNLYQYWQDLINKSLEKHDVVVNLSSNEFTKNIKHKNLVNMHFLDDKGRNLSTNAKISRGNMVNYIIKNRVTDVFQLKEYQNLGYIFDEARSDDHNYYFIKK